MKPDLYTPADLRKNTPPPLSDYGWRMLAEGELPPILGLWWLTLPLLALAVWLYLRDGRLPRARRLAA